MTVIGHLSPALFLVPAVAAAAELLRLGARPVLPRWASWLLGHRRATLDDMLFVLVSGVFGCGVLAAPADRVVALGVGKGRGLLAESVQRFEKELEAVSVQRGGISGRWSTLVYIL